MPERREEVTTEGGLDLREPARIASAARRLADSGCRVSLFIDPEPAAIRAAHAIGVPAVELHTGRYANTWRENDAALGQLRDAARAARGLGLAVHAGHGLTYDNVQPVAAITEIEELNIGHSIVSRAVMEGMGRAVSEMAGLIAAARAR